MRSDEYPRGALGREPRSGTGENDAALWQRQRTDFAADVPRPLLSAQIVQIDEAQHRILAALHREARQMIWFRQRQNDRTGRPEIEIEILQILIFGRRVTVQRRAIV